jgi:ubiquitin carboxyl-terminal hydrolase 34
MSNNESIIQISKDQKTTLRRKLEELEDDIHKSWLRDLDKVKELTELSRLLEQIYQKDSIEDFFDNQSDYEYFCKKFTHETLFNILRQHIVYGDGGDEVALGVIFAYLRLFCKFMERPQYATLWESMKDIFDDTKHFYKGILYGTNRVYNEKKLLTPERYNELMLPRKSANSNEVTEGMEIDVLVENRKHSSFHNEKKVWTRGLVTRVEQDYFICKIAEDSYPIQLKFNSFEFAAKGTMTKDYDWRMELQPNENIDCWDRGRWFPATILLKREDVTNGLKKIDYRIGFRVYPHLMSEWEDYRRFWPNKDINKDSQGRDYLGDIENIDEWIPSYSKRIQKFNTLIYAETKDSFENENYYIDDLVKYIDEETGKKTYVVGRNNSFSYFFVRTLNFFAEIGGFEKMVKLLSSDEKPNTDLIHFIFYVLGVSSQNFHKNYIVELGNGLYENIFTYMKDLSQNELRNMKKETFDIITKVLKFYLGLSLGVEQRNKIIEKFSISFAIKMIKTTYLEKRITAIKTIIDVIKSCRGDSEKRLMILKLIEDNQIFYEIYGPNSHIQLINKSKDLLEIMLKEDKLSDGEMEMIWSATKKGDLEGKLTILRTLKEISKSLQPKHISALLDNIYNSKSTELVDDEIDLIYELSTHKSQGEEILERCIKFFTQCLLSSKNDEGERTQILINKIFETTKLNPSFKSSVIKTALECLEKGDTVNLALKLLTKYLKDSDLETDFDLNSLLLQNNKLVTLFCDGFIKYINVVKEKAKNWTQDIDLLPLKDFSHSQNIKARLQFINVLISQRLWGVSENDPIDFVYTNLIENGDICEKDKQEFFIWISKSLESYVDYETQEKIFKLFNDKICKDVKSCQHLTSQAFDTYLKIFLDINARNNLLNYNRMNRDNRYDITVYTKPEKLTGFDILWQIVFESFSEEIMNKGIETLHSIFTNVFNIKDNDGEENSYSQQLLQKCLNLIKETIREDKQDSEKYNIVHKCLYILKLMIEESEKRGTAGVKSHSGLLKKKIVTVKVYSNLGQELKEFNLRVYGNTTMWELKEIISSNVKYCVDFLRVVVNNYELKNSDNGKTVINMCLDDDDEIKVSSNGLEKLIPQAELLINGEINEDVIAIINGWFEEYSTNDKMTKEDCAKFVTDVTAANDPIKEEDHRILGLFAQFDKNKDDLLERDEFNAFYRDCAIQPGKKKIMWENFRNMGIRNDLKKYSEPYNANNEDRTVLPRYQLAHNEDFFNTIFYLQDLSEDIAKEAFNFLHIISTNPKIYKTLLYNEDQSDWSVLLNEGNIYKLIYSLQVIESFIEDIEIDFNNIDRVRDANDVDIKTERVKKIGWMKDFVEKGGYQHLINILQNKLTHYVDILAKGEQHNLMNNICFEFLLKIVKIFYITSLTKSENYKKTNDILSRERSGSVDVVDELECLFSSELGDIILKNLDYSSLLTNLLELLNNIVPKKNKSVEENTIINTSYELVSICIPYTTEHEIIEKIIIENKNFINVSLYGLLHSSLQIRFIFSTALIKMCKLLEFSDRFNIILYFFKNIFELIQNISKEVEKNSNELFEFFSYLLEIYLSNPDRFNSDIDPKKFLKKLLQNIVSDINNEGDISLSNELFIGYLKVLTKVIENVEDIKTDISENYNLMQLILTKVLFKQTSDLNEKLEKYEYINPNSIDDQKANRNSNQVIRNVCYNFILCMLKGNIDNFEKFFATNLLEEKKEEKKSQENGSSAANSRYFSVSMLRKNEGYVGLRNPSCICYMNAILQQFFMIPALRYNLLRINDTKEPNLDNTYKLDDNPFHQIQRMFSYLELSERIDYNGYGFCYSFKDYDGNPTNITIQQDSQEFLSRFLDKMEYQIKPTPHRYLFQSILGGKTCSQLVCEQGCGTVKNRFEDFYTLSLEVNNMKTLHDSLENFIQPERIDEFNCEECKAKVTITKRNLLASLPNVLIVHLKRLFYNYENDRNEKINSKLEFPKVLNLKDYCIEEVMRKNAAKKAKEDSEEVLEDFETDDVYFKHQSYYEYHLTGVVVHYGSADAGHYYSYINTIRNGNENEAVYNPSDESHATSWLEFNDSNISKFNVTRLEDECYGGNYEQDKEKESGGWAHFRSNHEKIKSAYMLVYERRIKSPVKILVEPVVENASLVSFKEEEQSRVKKEYDICRHYDTDKYEDSKSELYAKTFYDAAKDEYFIYKPYYNTERLIPKKYYCEIVEDNTVFQKHQNTSDEQFVLFFDNVINLLDQTMSGLKEIKLETSIKISVTFMNFMFNILSQKDKQQLLKPAKDKFLHMIQSQPVCLIPVWEYISKHHKQLLDLILNENELVIINNIEMLYHLIKMAYDESPEKFLEAARSSEPSDDTIYGQAIKTLDFIISIFPKVPGRFVSRTGPIMKVSKF